MATNFPTSLDNPTNPTSSSSLTSPDHAAQHIDANDAIKALEAKVGVNGSAVTTSLDYKITYGIHSGLNVGSNILYVDTVNNRVGVNTGSPSTAVDVVGTATVRSAATQDGVILAGRAGGTNTYGVTITPTMLTASRTLTLPNETGTVLTSGGNTTSFRNLIINGDFRIWQRNTSNNVPTGYGYGPDRWRTRSYSTLSSTISRQTFAVGSSLTFGYEPQYFVRVRSTNTATLLSQPFESVRTLAGSTVNVSFWAKASSGTPSLTIRLDQYYGTGGSATPTNNTIGTATLSTSWTKYSFSATIADVASNIIGTQGDDYLELVFTSNTLNIDFDYWGIQVERGSYATPFEQRPIGTELALCQRYYYRETDAAVVMYPDQNGTGSTGRYCAVYFPVQMRMNTYTASGNAATGVLTVYKKSLSNVVFSRTSSGNSLGVDAWNWIVDAEF